MWIYHAILKLEKPHAFYDDMVIQGWIFLVSSVCDWNCLLQGDGEVLYNACMDNTFSFPREVDGG